MTRMQELHNEMQRHRNVCRAVSGRLDELSKSANDMGMDRLSDGMASLCDQLSASMRDMEKAVVLVISKAQKGDTP